MNAPWDEEAPLCIACEIPMLRLGDGPLHWCCQGCGATAMYAEQGTTARGSENGPWRVGRKLGRTLYVGDRVIGMVDTPELAQQIVDAIVAAAAAPAVPGRDGGLPPTMTAPVEFSTEPDDLSELRAAPPCGGPDREALAAVQNDLLAKARESAKDRERHGEVWALRYAAAALAPLLTGPAAPEVDREAVINAIRAGLTEALRQASRTPIGDINDRRAECIYAALAPLLGGRGDGHG